VFPNYIDVKFQAYFEMSSEDRRKILDEKYFDTNPLTCPKKYLPYLALEVGVNIDGLSEENARIAINEAINALNYKGTAKSFKSSLKPYTDAEVKEWYEYDGEPYYFKAVLSPTNTEFSFNNANFKRIKNVIDENKNVRSVLDGFEFELSLEEEVKTYVGFTFKSKINKDLQKDLKPIENLSFIQGAISNVSISSTLSLNLEPITNNTIQGAVIWRV